VSPAAGAREWNTRRTASAGVRVAVVLAVLAAGLATPGFFSIPALNAVLSAAALLGLVAVGMTFITISGNFLSLAVGVSVAACCITFIAASRWGMAAALALSIAAGIAMNAIQGFVIAYFRANPIIVSIAAFGLLLAGVAYVSDAQTMYPAPGFNLDLLRGKIWGIETATLVFVLSAILAQIFVARSRFGRELYLVGANPRAADVAGISATRVVTVAYGIAGLFCALSGILAGARAQIGTLDMGIGYEYDAFAAILLGGTAMHGGHGSPIRTFFGAIIYAAIATIVVMRGYSIGVQLLLNGVLILIAVCLYALEDH
jgi:ribose/xylose/arabinose/galactoside ABC-type transport system permease subunit